MNKPDIPSADGKQGQALWARADQVLPGGGIYYSRSADMAGRGVLPGFIASAEGCRVTDADGKTYIDYMGANGPNILGYRHPEVEEAVRRQMETLTSASLFPPSLVEVVEQLVTRFDGMAWGLVSKNGSEVVSLGARVARQHTQRRRLITFERAYHGNDPELATVPPKGPLTEGTGNVLRLPWNDSQALTDCMRAHGADIAAIILNPLDQNPRMNTVSAAPDFVAAIEEVRASRYSARHGRCAPRLSFASGRLALPVGGRARRHCTRKSIGQWPRHFRLAGKGSFARCRAQDPLHVDLYV